MRYELVVSLLRVHKEMIYIIGGRKKRNATMGVSTLPHSFLYRLSMECLNSLIKCSVVYVKAK